MLLVQGLSTCCTLCLQCSPPVAIWPAPSLPSVFYPNVTLLKGFLWPYWNCHVSNSLCPYSALPPSSISSSKMLYILFIHFYLLSPSLECQHYKGRDFCLFHLLLCLDQCFTHSRYSCWIHGLKKKKKNEPNRYTGEKQLWKLQDNGTFIIYGILRGKVVTQNHTILSLVVHWWRHQKIYMQSVSFMSPS